MNPYEPPQPEPRKRWTVDWKIVLAALAGLIFAHFMAELMGERW